MATINLGSIKFKWQGAYAGGTAYTVDDVVSYQGSSYICIQASTGNLPTNATYWEQMSSAGTNGTDGTDLGTTLTTQGDIVYRDASGLARLGAGTSGQVLQTGGTGANPSWTTMSSDMVKLNQNTITSNTYTVNVDNVFSSTYNSYRIVFSVVNNSGTNEQPGWRFIDSSGTVKSGSDYQYAGHHHYQGNGAQGGGQNSGSWTRTMVIPQETLVSDSQRYGVLDLYLYGVSNSNTRSSFQMFSTMYDGTYFRSIQQGGMINHVDAHRGIQFTNWNGNPVYGNGSTMVIYGIK